MCRSRWRVDREDPPSPVWLTAVGLITPQGALGLPLSQETPPSLSLNPHSNLIFFLSHFQLILHGDYKTKFNTGILINFYHIASSCSTILYVWILAYYLVLINVCSYIKKKIIHSWKVPVFSTLICWLKIWYIVLLSSC